MKELEDALRVYADPNEWRYGDNDSPWQLLFNGIDTDGDGFEIAKEALKEKI